MNVVNYVCALLSFMLALGLSIYFLKRSLLGELSVILFVTLSVAVMILSLWRGLLLLNVSWTVLLLILCAGCFVYDSTLEKPKPVKGKKRKASLYADDDDEYVTAAPTMTVKQIVSEYTRNPDEAEKRLTDNPMNVIGLITKISDGGTYSHIELDEKFLCICPQGSVRNLKPLQKVCITGTLRGKYLLDDCLMVKHYV